jgi:alpha-beta hydrolase superfamily lysophospholipase
VQVNYRGSTGYGKDFVNAGDREWAARCTTISSTPSLGIGRARRSRARRDLRRLVRRLRRAGRRHVHARRVPLRGGHRRPSNLKTLIEIVPPYWAPIVAQFHTRSANPEKDADFLWSRSPLSRASAIRIPLLIAQGANDPRVKQAESEQIVAALTAAGIDHEYMLFPDEGHGFAKPENRLKFYAAAERFLAKHLGGRSED